jgi:serine/threonine-protein kinase SRPK3
LLILPDFRPANILVKLANLDHLSEYEIVSLLGQPQQSEVMTETEETPPPLALKYLVAPADFSRLGNEYLTDDIARIDFGESYPMSSPPADLGIPEEYLPPEVLIEGGAAIGVGSDLWALGCTLFEIRRQMALFYIINKKDELLAEMVYFFRKATTAIMG